MDLYRKIFLRKKPHRKKGNFLVVFRTINRQLYTDSDEFEAGQHVISLNVSKLADGIYTIRLLENENYKYAKFVKN